MAYNLSPSGGPSEDILIRLLKRIVEYASDTPSFFPDTRRSIFPYRDPVLPNLRRHLDPPNPPQTPSEKVLGSLSGSTCFCRFCVARRRAWCIKRGGAGRVSAGQILGDEESGLGAAVPRTWCRGVVWWNKMWLDLRNWVRPVKCLRKLYGFSTPSDFFRSHPGPTPRVAGSCCWRSTPSRLTRPPGDGVVWLL